MNREGYSEEDKVIDRFLMSYLDINSHGITIGQARKLAQDFKVWFTNKIKEFENDRQDS